MQGFQTPNPFHFLWAGLIVGAAVAAVVAGIAWWWFS